jgi:NADPH2:quinone reductase
MFAIEVTEHGGPEVLHAADLADLRPGPGQLVVDVEAAGVNFIDTYQRTGLYPVPLPFVPGQEGAGTVRAVGSDVAGVVPEDRVAWADVMGSYAEQAIVPANRAVPVPDGVATPTAAAAMLQGMTAHYLVHDTFPLQAGQRCLVHAGAGGVGLLLIQMAVLRGAEVLTTVGSPEKGELARAAGAAHVLPYQDDAGRPFADLVADIAGEHAVDVVYDGVGKATFDGGLQVLRPRGLMVSFGNASGPVEPIAPLRLSRCGSLYLTRPSLVHYIATREELLRRAGDVLGGIASGKLDVRIGKELPLAEAASAHRLLEGRQSTGKVILRP